MLLHGMDDEDMNRDVTQLAQQLVGCITGVYTQCLPGSLILKAAWDLRAVCLGLAVVPTFAKTQTFN